MRRKLQDGFDVVGRRTATHDVFDELYKDIVSLKLLPGAKLSEIEVARRFGVSPQPVRDAFHRLSNIDLLLVRPKRATRVRGFSISRIEDARFIRLSMELEVLRRACQIWDAARAAKLQVNLERQALYVEAIDPDRMLELDYEFHRLICELGGCPRAFPMIRQQKQVVDRLCALDYGHRVNELETILQEHSNIAKALASKSEEQVIDAARKHFGRLDETIKYIAANHVDYFEEE